MLYVKQKKITRRAKSFKWQFQLINDNSVNACCILGGKVVVHSYILLITKNENPMAVVTGHEIVHAIARQVNERMSKGLLIQMGRFGLQVAMAN